MSVRRRIFSDERSPGTFHSLGVLPRRSRDTSPRKPPVFHIGHDDDEHSSLDEQSSAPFSSPPVSVRFPSSGSPPTSPQSSSSSTPCPSSPRPTLSRGGSAPILLSNGKPLKSSLKSSSSSPAMLIPPHMHLRSRSEPSTPSAPKNVHFPEQDYGLATVCIYNRSARPAALSSPTGGNGDETETEGEDTPSARFPFPSLPPVFNYEIDPAKSSHIPSMSSGPANLSLESLSLSSSAFPSASSIARPLLTGFILVRNLAFEKHVAIRFTLDGWQTVSEVGARYVDSLSFPPSQFSPLPSPEETRGRGWDRFAFTIHLEDYTPSLSTRTLWLAVRYRTNSTYPESTSSQYGPGGEWWDNNGGENYHVRFRPAMSTTSPRIKPRRETLSVPISSPRIQPQPPTTRKEHVLGLMIPSIQNKERRSTPLRAGKLNLCNYVPPTVRAPSSISFPSMGPPGKSPSYSISDAALPLSASAPSSSDEDNTSPASSTLSTPSASPTIVPRVIIGGQPATSMLNSGDQDDRDAMTYPKPGHIADWDWSASSWPRSERPSRQHVDLVPGSEPLETPRDALGRKAFSDNSSLYDTFVTQWCFAQGPSSNHHAYDGGIMT